MKALFGTFNEEKALILAFSGHCERLVDSSSSSVQHPAIVCRCRGGWLLFGPRGQCQWRGVLAAVFSQCIDQVPEVYGEPFVSFGYWVIFYQLCCGMPFTRGVLVPGARPGQHSEDQRSGGRGRDRGGCSCTTACTALTARHQPGNGDKQTICMKSYQRSLSTAKDSFFDNSIRRYNIM